MSSGEIVTGRTSWGRETDNDELIELLEEAKHDSEGEV
jgi:hypothetical protein